MKKKIDATKQLLAHWRQLQQDQMPLAQRAQALCDLLSNHPIIHQAIYLSWQDKSAIFQQESTYPRLPPGPGDPLNASDSDIKQRLNDATILTLEQVYGSNSWLAGRLKRNGWRQGFVVRFSIEEHLDGALVFHTDATDAVREDSILYLALALEDICKLFRSESNIYQAHSRDPHPSAICTLEGAIVQASAALHSLAKQEKISLEACLAANHKPLMRACINQARAIENVESKAGSRRLLWVYIPLNKEKVLLRAMDATEKLSQERAAAKAQRLYRVITENTTDLISRHTLEGVFLDASPASWTLLGYWPEELRGTSTRELFHPKDLAQLQQDAVIALQELGYHTMTYRLRHKLGHFLWFETASRAIRETYTGDVVEVVSVSRDITARVNAEENRRRLAEVVEVNTDLVLFVNLQGSLTYANKAARNALGLKLEPLSLLAEIFDETTFSALQKTGWRHAVRRGYWASEAQLYSANSNQALPVSLVLLAHKSAGGERYFSLVMRDMTERALREAEQRQYQEEKAHSARFITLGELASGIAHEMNQPLAAISNFAAASQRHLQQLPDQNIPAVIKVNQGLAHISRQAHHASEVIRRLRAFLRKGQRRLEPLSLAEVIQDAIRLCDWELERESIAVVKLEACELPPVYADRTLFEQVLVNLVRNAIEANRSLHLGQPSTITLRTYLLGEAVLIEVEDQGPGVDEETLIMMFTPFFTRKEDGLGLGLSMSRSIIEGFGGDLTAHKSLTQSGLTLRCALPMMKTKQEIK